MFIQLPSLLPIASFALAWLSLLGRAAKLGDKPRADWRDAFVTIAICWGTTVAATTELLGAFGLLRRGILISTWSALALGVAVVGLRSGYLQAGWLQARQSGFINAGIRKAERPLLCIIAAYLALLLVIAWRSPPNNIDSLLYHMTRVANWIQNASLTHYAASYLNQLIMPIWAELAILQFRLLSNSDQLSNLMQWFSMAGSLIVVSAIAGRLGIPRRGQTYSAAFAAAIPIGILQATSTQNDYVVGFWLACLAYILLTPGPTGPTYRKFVLFGLALGLALLTKATAYLYAAPLVIWFAWSAFRSRGPRAAAAGMLAVAALTATLNVGYWARNLATFGSPFGPPDTVRENLNLANPTGPDRTVSAEPTGNPARKGPLSSVGRAMVRNLMTPLPGLNAWLRRSAASAFGGDAALIEREMAAALWNHEDTAGNLLHLSLVPVALIAIPLAGRSQGSPPVRLVLGYGASLMIGLVLLSGLVTHASGPYGVRFQLPFFLLWSPLAGVAIAGLKWRRLGELVAVGVLLSALPWLLFNNTRPLIGRQPWTTRVDSVLVAPQSEIMFAMAPALRDPVSRVADAIAGSGCRQVELRADSSDPTYLFWWALQAPESGIRLETTHTYPVLERYLDAAFEPCAVICTVCQNRSTLGDLPLAGEYGPIRLYARDLPANSSQLQTTTSSRHRDSSNRFHSFDPCGKRCRQSGQFRSVSTSRPYITSKTPPD